MRFSSAARVCCRIARTTGWESSIFGWGVVARSWVVAIVSGVCFVHEDGSRNAVHAELGRDDLHTSANSGSGSDSFAKASGVSYMAAILRVARLRVRRLIVRLGIGLDRSGQGSKQQDKAKK